MVNDQETNPEPLNLREHLIYLNALQAGWNMCVQNYLPDHLAITKETTKNEQRNVFIF
jgi:hypothetical protein